MSTKHPPSSDHGPASPRRRRLLSAALASATLTAAGCGGDNVAGVGGGGTGSFASGPIRGFGSIVVNGIRFDDSQASIIDDAGAAARSDDLRLGMIVEVNGSPISAAPVTGRRQATAASIHVRSEIEGPISAIDVATGTLTVLGQTVRVTPATVFDDDLRGGLASLVPGQIVEIHGLPSGDGQYTATRIDDEDDRPSHYKLRGVVSGLDTAARTFRIGATVIDYRDVAGSLAGLADGQYARVELATEPDGAGHWRARAIQTTRAGNRIPDGERVEIELEGYISSFTSPQRFAVQGLAVDASGVARLPAGLAAGRRVEIEGQLVDGILVAREVELEDDDDDQDGFEVEGRITAVDTAAQTFLVRGVVIDYSQARFKDGTVADLVAGASVEVEGQLSSDGTRLVAREIEFDR